MEKENAELTAFKNRFDSYVISKLSGSPVGPSQIHEILELADELGEAVEPEVKILNKDLEIAEKLEKAAKESVEKLNSSHDETAFLENCDVFLVQYKELSVQLGTELEQFKPQLDSQETIQEHVEEDKAASELAKEKVTPSLSSSVEHYVNAFEYLKKVKEMWDAKGKHKASFDDWKLLCQEYDRLANKIKGDTEATKVLELSFIKSIRKEHAQAETLIKTVTDIRSSPKDSTKTLTDLKTLLAKLEGSKFSLESETRYIQNAVNAAQQFISQKNAILRARSSVKELEKLYENVTKENTLLKSCFEDVAKIIASSKEFVTRLKEAKTTAKGAGNRLSENFVEELLVEYKKLPCAIDEAENLQAKLWQSKAELVKCKKGFEGLSEINESTIDALNEIAAGLKKLPFDMGVEEREIRKAVAKKRFEAIAAATSKPELKPTFGLLKALFNEFKELGISDQMEAGKLKDIMLDASEDLDEIARTSEVAKLDNLEKKLMNKIVDYSEHFIEQRTRILMCPDLKDKVAGLKEKEPMVLQEKSTVEIFKVLREEEVRNMDVVNLPKKEPMKDSDSTKKHRGRPKGARNKRKSPERTGLGTITVKPQENEEKKANTNEPIPAIVNTEFETLRKEALTEFEQKLKELGTESKKMAECLEKDMLASIKGDPSKYRSELTKTLKNLALFAKYPRLSGYVGKGKLPLWKLCRFTDEKTVLNKMAKIEDLLANKAAKKAKEEDKIEWDDKSKLRAKLLDEQSTQFY
eukprot:TRINITY_DN822_c0_g2_i1.p3 TRINITY_DN822_c0_g2~~TRINITY_DN822_c0_g2_i1.p3  ORF type:complete len:789 (+),score=141.25 TRINITY_DN822_c0_g2_i1:110-2368(+)